MLLRDVEYGDVDAYVRMRCDPVMMAELGGPLPREGMEAKVRRDVQRVAADTDWTKMIVPDEAEPGVVAGSVTLWPHDADGERVSEIGWMVLPEYQGQGLGKQGVRKLLELARDDGRWGLIHAFPATTNAPSNGICRTLGFRFLGKQDVPFAGRVLQTNHWAIDPRTDLIQDRSTPATRAKLRGREALREFPYPSTPLLGLNSWCRSGSRWVACCGISKGVRYPQGGGLTVERERFREELRLRAAERFARGESSPVIAEDLRVSVRSVRRWRQAWQEGGPRVCGRRDRRRCRG